MKKTLINILVFTFLLLNCLPAPIFFAKEIAENNVNFYPVTWKCTNKDWSINCDSVISPIAYSPSVAYCDGISLSGGIIEFTLSGNSMGSSGNLGIFFGGSKLDKITKDGIEGTGTECSGSRGQNYWSLYFSGTTVNLSNIQNGTSSAPKVQANIFNELIDKKVSVKIEFSSVGNVKVSVDENEIIDYCVGTNEAAPGGTQIALRVAYLSDTVTFEGIKINEIPVKSHDLIKIEASAPSCKDYGNDEYFQCNNCEAIFADSEMKEELEAIPIIDQSGTHTDEDGNNKCDICLEDITEAEYTILISWGEMKFDYTEEYIWDTDKHNWTSLQVGEWTIASGSSNLIDITNLSSNAINVKLSYSGTDAGVSEGKFSCSENFTLSAYLGDGTDLHKMTAHFMPTSPLQKTEENMSNYVKVGTISINIE